jgi:dihydropteroate synthase
VLEEAATLDVPLSIDTTKSAVASRALLSIVLANDVWGLRKDPRMAHVVAEAEAAVVIMHNRAEKDENLDIIADIRRFFDRSLSHCGARWNSKTPCYPGRRYRLRQD